MKILFFDGYCSLCNNLVDWLVKQDQKSVLKFASLQGKTAQELLPSAYRAKADVDTVLYYREGKIYDRSTAIIKCLNDVGGPWVLLNALYIIPSPLRDLGYRFIASIRYKVFGKRDTCRIPLPEERQRLLP